MKPKYKLSLDFKSLKFKLWLYFLALTLLLIAVVWIANIYILNNSYEYMKAKQVRSFAEIITSQFKSNNGYSEDFVHSIKSMAIKNDMDIIIEDSTGPTYYISQNGDISAFEGSSHQPIYLYGAERAEIRQYLEQQDKFSGYSSRTLGGSSDYKILIFGTYLYKDQYRDIIIYLFSPLFPVASTVSILKKQLLIVTIIALFLTLIVATMLAARITKPLSELRKSAERLSNGEYGIDFEGGHYSEIIELGDTLTYTSHELAKSDQLRKDLIANVSHDLRTPLTMVKSYAEMIRDLSGDNPEKRSKHLQVIIDETDRLNRLVDDMFTLSKMQSGIVELKRSDFDFVASAREIYDSYDIIIEQDGYDIRFEAPESIMVNGDEYKIRQVIANLVNNAVKYCGDDKYISIRITQDNGYALFEVEDHGSGIPEEQLSHVWDRYYRVSSNYHRSSRGTGLGLSIVKEVLLLHGAPYGVESKVGEGSRFWFKLKTI
ncbi:MAG: sensor histidine kinase [Anaerovoracaceae bacterium]